MKQPATTQAQYAWVRLHVPCPACLTCPHSRHRAFCWHASPGRRRAGLPCLVGCKPAFLTCYGVCRTHGPHPKHPPAHPSTALAAQGTGGTASSAAAATAAAPAAPSAEQLSALQEALAAKGEEVRALKASGYTNQSPEVQFHVQGLTELKQQLASAQEAAAAAAAVDEAATSMAGEGAAGDTGDAAAMQGSSPKRRDVLPDDHPFATAAIWQLPATPLFFRAPRPVAKELAKQLASGFL